MWKRKTPTDVSEERKKLKLMFSGPVFIFFAFFLGSIANYILGNTKPGPPVSEVSTSFCSFLWRIIIGCMCLAFIAYILQVIFKKPIFQLISVSPKVMICNQCFRTKRSDGELSCECGGQFEDFDLWKWVDDNEIEAIEAKKAAALEKNDAKCVRSVESQKDDAPENEKPK